MNDGSGSVSLAIADFDFVAFPRASLPLHAIGNMLHIKAAWGNEDDKVLGAELRSEVDVFSRCHLNRPRPPWSLIVSREKRVEVNVSEGAPTDRCKSSRAGM